MRRSLIALAIIALIGYLAYTAGLLLEMEYPFCRVLAAVPSARGSSGVGIATLLRRRFGAQASRIHWHTCSYCARWGGLQGQRFHVQCEAPTATAEVLHFAFDREAGTIAPMTYHTAALVPGLLPESELAPVQGESLGNGEQLAVPRSWLAELQHSD